MKRRKKQSNEIVILSKASQTQKTNIICYCLYVEEKQKGPDELIYKTEVELQMEKTNRLPGDKGKRDELGAWD